MVTGAIEPRVADLAEHVDDECLALPSTVRPSEPLIDEAFESHPGLKRIRVEDGSGRALGRTFRVRLWPTLVFMRDGKELARVVRPTSADEISRAIGQIVAPA